MRPSVLTAALEDNVSVHLANVSANLKLIAGLGYGDVTLAIADERGDLTVVADARPSTPVDPLVSSRVGRVLLGSEEPEACATYEGGRRGGGLTRRVARGIKYVSEAHPIGAPDPVGMVLRTYGDHVEATPSRMGRSFIDSARDPLDALRAAPIVDALSGETFATTHRAGDGILRVGRRRRIAYASPNAVSIMRLAGVEGRDTGMRASELPGGGLGIQPVLGASGAIAVQMEVAGRVLSYR